MILRGLHTVYLFWSNTLCMYSIKFWYRNYHRFFELHGDALLAKTECLRLIETVFSIFLCC